MSEPVQSSERLVKAKSEQVLSETPLKVAPIDSSPLPPVGTGLTAKNRSRSEEPVNNLAMWSNEPVVVELVKGERGLGFSILDYEVNHVIIIV